MTIALSDENGDPTLSTIEETVRRVKPPNGVSPQDWMHLIECCVGLFRVTAGHGIPDAETIKNIDVDGVLSDKTLRLVFNYKAGREELSRALTVRGVLPLGTGLTAQQMIALEIISDPLQGNSIQTRLRKAQVSKSQFDKWMEHKPFADQLASFAAKRLNQAKSLVDIALTGNALDGQLDSIKYFDKRVGRDPDKKTELDGQFVVTVVIDALTKYLSDDPDKLRQIAAEIEVRLKLNGGPNN